MPASLKPETPRQRAPSQKAIATRERILESAEKVFAANGFDGATLRDIAALAGVRVSLVHHHGGGKEALFERAVARRAEPLAAARQAELAGLRAAGAASVEAILRAFIGPLLDRAAQDPGWGDHARLVAHVSADPRWQGIASRHFDPTAQLVIDALTEALPGTPRARLAGGFVYAVAAQLAHVTATWRIDALAGAAGPAGTDRLVAFCAEGLRAAAR